MITATLWVPRGAAAAFPTKYDIDDEELARISELAKLHLEDAKDNLDHAERNHHDATETEDSDMEDSGVNLPRSQAYTSLLLNRSFIGLTSK